MKGFCFKCGGKLEQVKALSKWTERFGCGKCRTGYLLSKSGNCLFLSKTLPTNRDTLPIETPNVADDFDFGLADESTPPDGCEYDLGF